MKVLAYRSLNKRSSSEKLVIINLGHQIDYRIHQDSSYPNNLNNTLTFDKALLKNQELSPWKIFKSLYLFN